MGFHSPSSVNPMTALVVLLVCALCACAPCASASRLPADVDRNITQIIQAKGYTVETHKATTPDGYILSLFHMPPHGVPSNGRAVILQHGLMDCAFTWVLNFPTQSLPYILAQQGWSVWLSSARGTTYGMENTHISPTNTSFWLWSYDEMATLDLPTVVDYVVNATSYPKVSYVGHSQGTITMFAAMINKPELADKVSSFAGLGPVTTASHTTNEALKVLAELEAANLWEHVFGEGAFAKSIADVPVLAKMLEEVCIVCGECCADVIELICGPHKKAFNNTRMPVVVSHEPGGTSVRNMQHWAQDVRSGNFQRFDYGKDGNMKHYGTPTPPLWDYGRFPKALPVALWSGSEDELADPKDVLKLIASLQSVGANLVSHTEVPGFAHLDYIWAYQDAPREVYPDLIAFLNKYA